MDNIIVNSALWYAEQSSQFLVNSGANKLLDKGYDYYVKEFIPLGHRLIQNGQIAADAMDGELAAQFSMAYVANYWRAAKISPLWMIKRLGCARSQLGVVLVE